LNVAKPIIMKNKVETIIIEEADENNPAIIAGLYSPDTKPFGMNLLRDINLVLDSGPTVGVTITFGLDTQTDT
jgi:hypothetical protein